MAKTITCFVGLLRPDLQLPVQPLAIMGQPIGRFFDLGSQDENGNPGIALRVDESTRISAARIPNSVPTDAFALNKALSRMLLNSNQKRSVNRIGLIFADKLNRHPKALGLMFDLGFNIRGLKRLSKKYTGVPREGCAVFLDAIGRLRGRDTKEYKIESIFTAIHELGHVFNLWHKKTPASFMSSSKKSRVHPPSALNFQLQHRHFLSKCETSSYVWPGGSRFGRRGGLGPKDTNPTNKPCSKLDLKLEISMSQTEFWNFEPVELEIFIKSKNKRSEKSVQIPDKIDPGYDCFQIWIECPDGTRFKYRSPRIYCDNFGTITIGANHPFHRDISIFGQSGGYTFGMPGEHILQAIFILPDQSVLTSNFLTINIKESMPGSSDYRELYEFFTCPEIAHLLYHRNGIPLQKVIDEAEAFCEKRKNTEANASVRYALGAMLFKTSLGKSSRINKKHVAKSIENLAFGLDNKYLSPNRRTHAEELIESIQE